MIDDCANKHTSNQKMGASSKARHLTRSRVKLPGIGYDCRKDGSMISSVQCELPDAVRRKSLNETNNEDDAMGQNLNLMQCDAKPQRCRERDNEMLPMKSKRNAQSMDMTNLGDIETLRRKLEVESENDGYKQTNVKDMETKSPRTIFLVNNIEGCCEDIQIISNLFKKIGYIKVIQSAKIASFEEMKQEIIDVRTDNPGDLIVIFFGYHFKDYVFIDETENECISFYEFYNILGSHKTKEDSVVLITHCFFKLPTEETILFPDSDDITPNIYHLYASRYSQYGDGSLLTRAIQEAFDSNKYKKFYEFASFVCCSINEIDNNNSYYTDIRLVGVVKPFLF